MADILITGANGQVGWEAARQARASGLSVHATGRADLDITDRRAVYDLVRALRPAVVINAAAYTAVDRAEAEPDMAHAVNTDGPGHLAEACAGVGAALIHISTDYVFDGTKPDAYTEDDRVAPLGVYGASKLAGERGVRTLLPRHLILRTSWVYGVHGQNFVKTMVRLGRERPGLRVVDDQHGCPTFAGDLAAAALTLARRIRDGEVASDAYGTFHCANRGQTTWCGFARAIFETAAMRLDSVPEVAATTTADYPTPARRPANSVLDCSRLERVHGISLRPWPDALSAMLGEWLPNAV